MLLFPMLGALWPFWHPLHIHMAFLLRFAGYALSLHITLSIGFNRGKRHWACPGFLSHVGLYLVEDRGLTARIGAGAVTGGSTGEATIGRARGAGTGVEMAGDGATETGAGAGEADGRPGMGVGGESTGDGGG